MMQIIANVAKNLKRTGKGFVAAVINQMKIQFCIESFVEGSWQLETGLETVSSQEEAYEKLQKEHLPELEEGMHRIKIYQYDNILDHYDLLEKKQFRVFKQLNFLPAESNASFSMIL